MNLAQLKAFEALARFGNFSQAAEALNVTQPAISNQLKTLQESYDVSLFRRQGYTITLSTLGLELLPRAKQAIHLITELDRLLASTDPQESGELALGLCDPHSTLRYVSDFACLYPNTKIFCTMANSASLLRMLSECQIDVAFINALTAPKGVFSLRCKACSLSAIVTRDHKWAGKKAIDIREFHNEGVILRERESTSHKLFLDMTADKAVSPDIVLEFNSREGLKRAVSKGLGIGVVHEVSFDRTENLVEVKINGSQSFMSQYLICAPEFRHSPSVQAFFQVFHDTRTAENLGGQDAEEALKC
jgi:LysR family transcriptional regulator, low CO2-responsive transcriptional regulator